MKKVVITAVALGAVLCVAVFFFAVYRLTGFVTGRRAFQQGYAAMERGEYKKAIPFFTDSAQKPSAPAWRAAALVDRGYCYFRLDQRDKGDKAIPDFTAALQLKPDAFAFEERAFAYEQAGRSDLAFADYEKALQLDPNLAAVWYHKGVYYENAGNYQMARTAFREAIRSFPDYADAYVESGYSSGRLHDRDGAISSFDAAIQINPESANAFSARGVFRLEEQQYDSAIADLTKAIALAPKTKRHSYARAIAYEDTKRYSNAIEDFTRVLELDPRDELAWQRRGMTYRRLKDYPRALADFTELIKLTQSADAYNDRARTYAMTGQYPLALADYEEVRQTARGAVKSQSKSMAWFLATCPDPAFRDGAKAVKQATKACEDSRWKNSGKLDTLAAAKAEVGKFDEAISYEQKAIALLSKDSEMGKQFDSRLALYQAHKPFRDEIGR
ncbi:MAG: tetratricopeptide repeat protein [Chthoniobacterales bacterium]